MRAVAVFLAVAVADWLWSAWMLAITNNSPMLAGTYSAAIVLVGAYATMSMVKDRLYIIPAVLGAFTGTWLAVR